MCFIVQKWCVTTLEGSVNNQDRLRSLCRTLSVHWHLNTYGAHKLMHAHMHTNKNNQNLPPPPWIVCSSTVALHKGFITSPNSTAYWWPSVKCLSLWGTFCIQTSRFWNLANPQAKETTFLFTSEWKEPNTKGVHGHMETFKIIKMLSRGWTW